MPVRFRRLLFHALLLFTAVVWFYPVFRFQFTRLIIEENERFMDMLSRQDWIQFILIMSLLLVYLLLQLLYLFTFWGMFKFYRWARITLAGWAVLMGFLLYLALSGEMDRYFVLVLSLHVPAVLLCLLMAWTPFVGGEFKRMVKDL